ncbi:DUF4235 domain-containing protein [Rhodopirellula sp. JC740]|uniref:DUF4235 domain-containing protein n=1 Tax=Rhodopirellula halodulae TaxID=2894198 RepID=A0ABS8NEQ7_9BACT|nr:DUF4235 domain-containing protein [Rhodopirellula sp. JC740]MCC9642035.1 DUF4235 domain-containing protein [Rhodopirellula sp. JC740]
MQEQLEQLKDRATDFFDSDHGGGSAEADGRNAGIGQGENMLAFATAIGCTFLVRQGLQLGWRAALKRDPPKNPTSHEVAWREALLWGAVSGAIVGAARIASRRASSSAYRSFRSTP